MSGIALTGLASGMDTSAMIEELMKLERKPYTDLETRKSTIASNQEIMRSINTKLSTLKNAASDLRYSTAFNINTAKVSNSSMVNVTAASTAAKGTYTVEVTQLAKKQSVKSTEFKMGSGDLVDLVGKKFSLSGKGDPAEKEITLRGDTDEEVLKNLMSDINAAKMGVSASVIETQPGHKTLVLTSDEYGTEQNMKLGTNTDGDKDKHTFLSDPDGALISLGLSDGSALNELQAAQNAKLKVNGLDIESASNTLREVVPGLTMDLLQDGKTTVTISQDEDAVADKVQTFVDAYNDVIRTIRKNTAKGEALQGDSTLRTLEEELNRMLNSGVGGNNKYGFLSRIGLEVDKGVTTGSLMTGEINFDKEIFKKALAESPEDVYNLFAYEDAAGKSNGIGTQFNDTLTSWTRFGTGIMATKIQGYDSDLTIITEQMERLNTRLQNKEALLQKQFAAMESALANMQSQQSWLTSQLNALG